MNPFCETQMLQEVASGAHTTAQLLAVGAVVQGDPLSALGFLLREGRMPRIGDSTPPWRYKGWLRLLIQALHAYAGSQTGFPDRWGYLAQVVTSRALPAAPIPQVDFCHPDSAILKKTEEWLTILDRAGGQWNSFQDFVRFLGWGLGVIPEDPNLPDKLSEELYRTVDLGQWLKKPGDYLGELAAIRYGGGPHKFFPTPHSICEAMARFIIQEGREEKRGKSCNDPAMGSGRMLLHASNYSLRLSGNDIDEVMVMLTRINLAVYAPWGLFNLDFLGDPATLTVELPDGLV